MSVGTLYLVATPIGNLEDLGRRAERILGEVSLIACEDTRVTRKLLEHYSIKTRTTAYHAHSGDGAMAGLLARLSAGESVALVSDAGTPLLSDPGQELVAAAAAAGIAVVPIPGPSALLSALSGSGLPTARVLYLGFLPEDSDRREVLSPLRAAPYTVVIYEAANRVPETLEALQRSLGDRPACLARELTKRFETFDRGLLSALISRHSEPPRGEVVLVIGPAEPESKAHAAGGLERAREEAKTLLAGGMRAAEVARVIAGAHGLARSEAYRLVMEAKA